MRVLVALLVLFTYTAFLGAQEVITQDDFITPLIPEKELLKDLNLKGEFDSTDGLYLSGAAILGGSILTYAALQGVGANGMDDPYSADLQAGIVLTGAGLLGTAFFALIFDAIKASEAGKATLEE
ncbi:MAG: hypothetical protein PQJ59_14635 [Spirochaetales bacterium]|nr:hypothetical protein [Spirochaetales bacterium]